jgi:para-nitrobenzyl esterase
MKKNIFSICSILLIFSATAQQHKVTVGKTAPIIKTHNGLIEGVQEASGILSFKGIPFAAPPVGALRWKEPQPVNNWKGVLETKRFGPRAMQPSIFGDMVFRSNGMSEDCLYLNVWTPNLKARLPVLVYFYGGGFVAGDGSESRYDGESMAGKGIVTLTVNYRLGVFASLAHPELSKESPHHVSGNYGLMDQTAALLWVKKNIAAFGGDPEKITIAGESAGSIAVSAQMASPLSKNLIAGAIGESGSLLGALPPISLKKGEENGTEFAKFAAVASFAELRNLPSDSILSLSSKFGSFRFPLTVDGYFFPKEPFDIFNAGEQAKIPLLVGWNSEEMNHRSLMGNLPLTLANFETVVKKLYGEKAVEILRVYSPATDADVEQVATDLSGDRFIGFSTWRWSDLQAQTSGQSVYRYYYTHPRPSSTSGAVHSAEIEYCLGNLSSNKVFAWTPDDYKLSATMQAYFANFIKTGNPNGKGLLQWPATKTGNPAPVMLLDVNCSVRPDKNAERYKVLEAISK